MTDGALEMYLGYPADHACRLMAEEIVRLRNQIETMRVTKADLKILRNMIDESRKGQAVISKLARKYAR